MSHTHSRLLYHIIFGTKNRVPWIEPHMRDELYAYMASLVVKHHGHVYKINGMPDHVHCVIQMSTEPSVGTLVRDLKSYSSGWMKRRYGLHGFAWQEGFGPFSISASRLQQGIDYVENQQEHHRGKTFQEEYEEFRRKHGVKYAPEDLFN